MLLSWICQWFRGPTFPPLSAAALRAVKRADRLARNHYYHEYLGTEHLLLGLARTAPNGAADILLRFELTPDRLRREVEQQVKAGPEIVTIGSLPPTPTLKKVFAEAAWEAGSSGRDPPDEVDLLIGLLRTERSIGGDILRRAGMTLEAVRAARPGAAVDGG